MASTSASSAAKTGDLGEQVGHASRGPLFGRGAELRVLEKAYDDVVGSGGLGVVTILGAAGVGKSRLVAEFLARARSVAGRPPPRVQRTGARPHGAAYDLIARFIRTRFDVPVGTPDEMARASLRTQLTELLGDQRVGDVLYFVGGLIDLKFNGSPLVEAIEGDPVQLKALRRAVLRRVVEADAAGYQKSGVLTIVVEDLHNAHDDTLEIFEIFAAHFRGPVLIVITARPELLARHGSWGAANDNHAVLQLGPLHDSDAQQMMEQLLTPVAAGGEAIPRELIESACELAGGNPALLERMVRIFHDSGVLRTEEVPTDDPFLTEERWHVSLGRLSAVRLPLTVRDAVDARLSALSPVERDLLAKAASMGSVFWLGGLVVLGRLHAEPPALWAAEQDVDERHIAELLEELVARDYLLPMPDPTFPGEQEYVFKHNLEREALEKLVPAAAMRRYHRALADWLDFRAGVRSHEEHIASLAWHRERAGARTRAALTWLEAGDIARDRYANAKSAECYARGLALLGDDDARSRLEALHHYGDVLCLLGQYDEAIAQFNAMLGLAFALDLKGKGGAAHNRIGRLYRDSGMLDEASHHLRTGLALFERARDERGVASSLDDIGKLHWMRGEYHRALEDLRAALATRKRLGDRRSIALSLNNLGLVLQDSGHFKEALEAFERSLRIRRDIGDLMGVVLTLNNLGTVAQDQRDEVKAMALFKEALSLAREVGDRHKIVLVLTNIGETQYRLGETGTAVATLLESEGLADEIGDRLLLAEAVRGLGKAYMLHGDLLKAREYTSRAVQLFEQVRSKVQIGIALRTLGEVTAGGGWGPDHVSKAKGYFLRSIAIFDDIGNDVERARSHRAYAEFLRRVDEAAHDPAVQAEADDYARKADDVFAKLRISAVGIDPSAFFS